MPHQTGRAGNVLSTLGRDTLDAVLRDPAGTLLALDFDGTLAPIIEDPSRAHAEPRAVEALSRLGTKLAKIAVVTGRPVLIARELGGFESYSGLGSMSILGQYGVERWDAATGETRLPPAPPGIAVVQRVLPDFLSELGLAEVMIEDKERAIVLHTRSLVEPDQSVERLRGPIIELATQNDLIVEPGKHVLEIRGEGVDKGDAMRKLALEAGARQIIFGGDDLGDLPAFEAVEALRETGVPGLLLCSASTEQDALVSRADVVLDGPLEVADWLSWLADELGA